MFDFQKNELHMVRRTACYDASPRIRQGRVLFGETDERVRRLVGLIDSVPTLDILEIEPNTNIVRDQLRRSMVDQTCNGSVLIDVY